MKKDAGGLEKRMEATLTARYNIRDTKKYFSEINNAAVQGREIITFNAARDEEEVSHLRKQYVDALLANLKFSPVCDFDEEMHVYTVSLPEIDLYGEGATKEKAVADLLNSVSEYLQVYAGKIALFSKLDPVDKQLYMLKLARCNGNREAIQKEIGL